MIRIAQTQMMPFVACNLAAVIHINARRASFTYWQPKRPHVLIGNALMWMKNCVVDQRPPAKKQGASAKPRMY
jgi:hypothetical protein